MIISASYKTDIPAFYSDWFMERLEAGFCAEVNPRYGQLYVRDLSPNAVEGIVFWTKNIGPMLPEQLDRVREMGYPFVVQHTINGYAQSRFEAVIDAEAAVANMHRLCERYGPRCAVWRYDPIVLSSKTPPERHLENFTSLAKSLQGAVDEVVISFVQPFRKTQRNMRQREEQFDDFDWQDEWIDRDRFEVETRETKSGKTVARWKDTEKAQAEKIALVYELAKEAASHGMQLTVCSQKFYGQLREAGKACPDEAKCIDTKRLVDVAQSAQFSLEPDRLRTITDRLVKVKIQPANREECQCYEARDIGDYDTCPYGCAYCYAVSSREKAKEYYAAYRAARAAGTHHVFLNPALDEKHREWVQNELPQKLQEQREKLRQEEEKRKKKDQVEQISLFGPA